MNMVALIQKKKDGKALQREEIQWIIDGYVAVSCAWAMGRH